MESHKEVLAEVGIDVDDIKAPDLCVVGEYLGPTGELDTPHASTSVRIWISICVSTTIVLQMVTSAAGLCLVILSPKQLGGPNLFTTVHTSLPRVAISGKPRRF